MLTKKLHYIKIPDNKFCKRSQKNKKSKIERSFFTMSKQVTFKTIFPAVSVPLNDDYSINEKEFRVYLR
ncbi:MAG: hypothetical protein IJ597_00980 [Synergistaceae bacterium]|nr:hypothetical protein [Synergistaceae bacterium]